MEIANGAQVSTSSIGGGANGNIRIEIGILKIFGWPDPAGDAELDSGIYCGSASTEKYGGYAGMIVIKSEYINTPSCYLHSKPEIVGDNKQQNLKFRAFCGDSMYFFGNIPVIRLSEVPIILRPFR